jgi:transposase
VKASTRRTSRSGATSAPAATSPRPRRSAEQAELDRLGKKNAKLESELERTKLALEITGKAHALLELLSESADIDPKYKQ